MQLDDVKTLAERSDEVLNHCFVVLLVLLRCVGEGLQKRESDRTCKHLGGSETDRRLIEGEGDEGGEDEGGSGLAQVEVVELKCVKSCF